MGNDKICNDLTVISLLTFGNNIELNHFTLINYKIKEIFNPQILGLVNYYGLIGICLEKPKDIFNNNVLTSQLKDFLNMFTNCSWNYIGKFKVFEAIDKDNVYITEENIGLILDLFAKMYGIDDESLKKESNREDIDDDMKELLKEFEEEQSKVDRACGVNINLISIIEAVSCKHHSLNLTNIGEYTIYQLYRAYKKLNKIDHENRLTQGYYAGTLKLENSDFKQLHWANEN